MKKALLFTIVIIAAFASAKAQNWTKVEGPLPYINFLKFSDTDPNVLYVGSDSLPTDISRGDIEFPFVGWGYMKSADKGATFAPAGLAGRAVYWVHEAGSGNLYASVRFMSTGGVVRSTDNGATWDLDYVACEGSDQVSSIVKITENGVDKLLASAVNTNSGLKVIESDLSACFPVANMNVQSRRLIRSKVNPNLIFMAGDDGSQGHVLRSYDNGKTWLSDESGLEGLRINAVLQSSKYPNYIYAGADQVLFNNIAIGKGIYMSLDTGKTWQALGAPDAQVFDLVEHPTNPEFMAAACGSYGVFVSGNAGQFWEQHLSGLPADSLVTRVAIPDEPATAQGVKVLAGVQGAGLYKSDYITSGVRESAAINALEVFPNPISDRFNVSFIAEAAQPCRLTIYDPMGGELYAESFSSTSTGSQVRTFAPGTKLTAGAYFIELRVGARRMYHKIMVRNE